MFNLLKDVVKEAIRAAMGGDDFELTAPGGDGLGDAVEEGLVLVEGKFIKDDVAALAGEGVGIGGEGMDGATVGEAEDAGGIPVVGQEQRLAGQAASLVEAPGPEFAVLNKETGLEVIAGTDPDIVPGTIVGGAHDRGEGGGKGEADLAGFFHDFELGGIVNPAKLIGEEVGVRHGEQKVES